MESLKHNLNGYIEQFGIYDYLAFGWLGLMLILLFVLIILLARKKPKLAIFMTIFVIVLIVVAPFALKFLLDQSIRKVDITTDKVTKLNFASTLVIQGHLKHSGKVDYKGCQITADVVKYDKNSYKKIINRFQPIRSKTIVTDKNLTVGDVMDFKIIIDNFHYKGDYNVTLSGVCY